MNLVQAMLGDILVENVIAVDLQGISVGQTSNVKGVSVLRLTQSEWKIGEDTFKLNEAVKRILRLMAQASLQREHLIAYIGRPRQARSTPDVQRTDRGTAIRHQDE